MQIPDIKYLRKIDQDVDPKFLDANGATSKKNMRSYKPGFIGINVPIDGTFLLAQYPGHSINGWCKDVKNKAVLIFLAPNDLSNNSKIVRYFLENDTVQQIVSAKLNFRPTHWISADVVGDMIYWTDGYFNKFENSDFNQPRKINIDKAINIDNINVSLRDRYPTFTNVNIPQITNVAKNNMAKVSAAYTNNLSLNQNYLREKLFQFRVQYVWDDKEQGAWSEISNLPTPIGESNPIGIYGNPENTNNEIVVTFELGPDQVESVNVAYREGNNGHWRQFKTIHKWNEDDTWAGAVGRVSFFGNEISYPLDDIEVGRLFFDVPISAKVQKFIDGKNILYGNYLTGYRNTQETDLTITQVRGLVSYEFQSIEAALFGTWYVLYFGNFIVTGDGALFSVSFKYHDDNADYERNYFYTAQENESMQDVIEAIATWFNESIFSGIASVTNITPNVLTVDESWDDNGRVYAVDGYTVTYSSSFSTQRTFKSGSSVEVGVIYYDDYGRCGGVQAAQTVKIPFVTESYPGIHWMKPTMATTDLKIKIDGIPPAEAKYFQLAVSPKQRRYFQFLVEPLERDVAANMVKIRLNDSIQEALLNNSKVTYGYYDFQKRDRVRIIGRVNTPGDIVLSSDLYDMEIIDAKYDVDEVGADKANSTYKTDDADGDNKSFIVDENGNKVKKESSQYLVVKNFDFESEHWDNYNVLIEVYSPELIDDENNLFNELPGLYTIQGAHTPNRLHGPGGFLEVTIQGDSYVKPRVKSGEYYFMCEDTHFSDIYESNFWNKGRPNVVIEHADPKWNTVAIKHSRQYIKGAFNGLSNFDASEILLDEKYGEIRDMDVVGYILKVIQDTKVTSIYIGRTVIDQADGTTGYVGYTDKLLGTIVPSTLDFGTIFPKSVATVNNAQYFFDVFNGVMVRESSNGPFPISKYGLNGYFKQKSKEILSNLGQSEVSCGWDGLYNELNVTFTINGVSETITFHEDENLWSHSPVYTPMGYAWLGDRMLSYYDEKLWKHNQEGSTKIYGNDFDCEVEIPINIEPLKSKIFQNIQIKGTTGWSAEVAIYDDLMNKVAESVIYESDFVNKNDMLWANFRRNGTTPIELVNGNRLKGRWMKLKLKNSSGGVISYLVVNSIVNEKS
jgi:hypothetical protein